MKASELRIGNIVYLWNNALEYSEFEINYTAIRQIHQGIEAYTPIPLTEEWLLKFGFKNVSKVFHKVGFQMYGKKVVDNKGFHFRKNELSIEIKYVHQLQNLYFALTGEELTYETTK